ncbi:hypothetical protein VSR68_39645, partial [Paraburkholderia phymatum]
QKRLCQRFRNLMARGKLKNQVCTAIARELAGFIWAIGQHVAPSAGLSRAGMLVELATGCFGQDQATVGEPSCLH